MKVLLMLILMVPFFVFATKVVQEPYSPCNISNNCIEIAYEDMASNSQIEQSPSLNQYQQKPIPNKQLRAPKKEHPGVNKYVGIAIAVVVGLVVIAIIFSRRDIPND